MASIEDEIPWHMLHLGMTTGMPSESKGTTRDDSHTHTHTLIYTHIHIRMYTGRSLICWEPACSCQSRCLGPGAPRARTFEEMQADSPRDLISRELLLSSLHPGPERLQPPPKADGSGFLAARILRSSHFKHTLGGHPFIMSSHHVACNVEDVTFMEPLVRAVWGRSSLVDV